jgi:hypothetical protein
MNNDATAFTGWHRLSARHPWRPIVQAEGQAEAWAMLQCTLPGGDKMVTALHREPNNPGHPIGAESRRART